MNKQILQPESFAGMVNLVVGACNGVKSLVRWEKETPLFVEAILRHITPEVKSVLDYGCGIGRLAKGVMEACPNEIEIYGVDDSTKHLEAALAYVNSEHFETLHPLEFQHSVDLAYCIYVLHHIPAIELRETLHRIHSSLRPGGIFLHCSSELRMCVRYDKPEFFDDRFLGVNLQKEIERFFEPIGPLFDEETVNREEILQQILLGKCSPSAGERPVLHPATVYRRKDIQGPLFNVPQ